MSLFRKKHMPRVREASPQNQPAAKASEDSTAFIRPHLMSMAAEGENAYIRPRLKPAEEESPAQARPAEEEKQDVLHEAQTPADGVEAAAPARPQPALSQGCDWMLFVFMVMLLGIGLIMVLSASGIVAEASFGDKYYYFKRQLGYAALGGTLMAIIVALPRSFIYKLHYVGLFIGLFLLLLTLSPLAPSINGAHRWIRLGPVNIQPMEFVKIALALYLGYYMSAKQDMVKTFARGVIPPFAVTLLFCGLLLLQPDFGSAVVLAMLLFFMCVAGGTRLIYIFCSLAMGAAAGVALAIFEPYRMRRLMAFVDPFQDASNTGYQLVQSLLAIGSGSFFGVGIGASRQKMFYLPEAHNDFIMAVLAEEMGFVGVSAVMLLFVLFFWRCYQIIQGQENLRDRYTSFAVTVILCLGVLLNLAVVMGAAPPKGVPLPFLSYGGSNLVASMICVGLLLNLSRTARLSGSKDNP